VQYLLSSGYGIYPSGGHICQDKSAYPGIRKTSTAATVKARSIRMCVGRAGLFVKHFIGFNRLY